MEYQFIDNFLQTNLLFDYNYYHYYYNYLSFCLHIWQKKNI